MGQKNLLAAFAVCLLIAPNFTSTDAYSLTKKPAVSADITPPETSESRISLELQINPQALTNKYEKSLPDPLFNQPPTERGGCAKGKIAGIRWSIGCRYWGSVRKTGPIQVGAENGMLTASVPLFATFSGQTGYIRVAKKKIGGFQETADARAVAVATVKPEISADWKPKLNATLTYRWTDRPEIKLFNVISITIGDLVDGKIRPMLAGFQTDLNQRVSNIDLRSKAAAAWAALFEPILINKDHNVWIRMSPRTVAYSGLNATGGIVTASVAVETLVETRIGKKPAAFTTSPLPNLQSAVPKAGNFTFFVPVIVDYEAIETEIETALSKGKQWNPIPGRPEVKINVLDAKVYPSNGKVVVGLRVKADFPGQALDTQGWVYILGIPRIDNATKTIRVEKFEVSTETDSKMLNMISTLFNTGPLLYIIEKHATFSFEAQQKELLEKANVALNKKVGDMRIIGAISTADVADIKLEKSGFRLELRAAGHVKVIVGN